jgi:acyl-CoA reductase-like NAD-dependent aldehyde dehydrogenase
MSDRLAVRKTYKLYVDGAFPRSESGRSYVVTSADGAFLANVAQGSRKDLRDAVRAARAAQPKWWAMSAYTRGQVLYRLAEMVESRRAELAEHVALAEGAAGGAAADTVAAAIDRIVWYAGWADKVTQVLGGANPVAGPFFNFSLPTPSGVVGVIAPEGSSLLGLVDAALAPVTVGNAVVVVPSESRPTPALLLGEMAATSDLPGGVVNLVAGRVEELAPVLAAHEDVDGIDLTAAANAGALAATAAESIKRVLADAGSDPLRRMRAFVETSTVWHTIGQ